jgi:hypothetical protein
MGEFLEDIPDLLDSRKPKTRAAAEEPAGCIVWKINRCPYCHSADHHIYSMRLPIRYHQCRRCKKTFKSIEQAEK